MLVVVLGNGIDIIEIKRIEKAVNNRLLERICTEKERQYIEKRKGNIKSIAGIFAAKEAVSKALGVGIKYFSFKDIEIDHDNNGKPIVKLMEKANKIAESRNIDNIHISISHDNEKAVAFAIAEGNEKLNVLKDTMEMKNILPKRKKVSHKGTYGKVGIIAGSLGMTGASYLTTTSCLRSGSGLVYTLTPKSLTNIMEVKTTEAIIKPVEDNNKGHFIPDSIKEIKKAIDNVDVLAIGPGMGVDNGRIKLLKEILRYTNLPIVLDGDGLNCVSQCRDILIKYNGDIVITPHPGELSRLLNIGIDEIQSNRIESAKKASKIFGVITVLKGANTIVCNKKGEIYINNTGNPGMATAGSGDVLTGIITSLIGQGLDLMDSAKLGVYLHGLSGDLASHDKGEYGLISSDIIERIPYAIKTIL